MRLAVASSKVDRERSRRDGAEGSTPAFSCQHIDVTYGEGARRSLVLNDVSFDVGEGQFLSILGGSGVGKTTLLRVMAGLVECTAGSVMQYHGQDVLGPPPGVVFVFQDYRESLLSWRTVEGNVRLGLEGKVAKAERSAAVKSALQLVGLQEQARKFPSQLSGGMQQRVQLARAMVLEPECLLMDEPFGSLDAMTKARLQDEFLALHARNGFTVVFVTHDIDEAVYMSDRLLVLGGAPAQIRADISVPLPRPRHQVKTKEDPVYLALRRRAYAELEGAR